MTVFNFWDIFQKNISYESKGAFETCSKIDVSIFCVNLSITIYDVSHAYLFRSYLYLFKAPLSFSPV